MPRRIPSSTEGPEGMGGCRFGSLYTILHDGVERCLPLGGLFGVTVGQPAELAHGSLSACTGVGETLPPGPATPLVSS